MNGQMIKQRTRIVKRKAKNAKQIFTLLAFHFTL